MLPPTIHTRRLVLRPPLPGDTPVMFASYTQDPEVTRYLTWRPHQVVADTERFVGDCITAWAGGARFPWVITRREADVAIGMVDLRLEGHAASLGYVLARAAWGRGYMTEAVKAVARHLPRLGRLRRRERRVGARAREGGIAP
jgi:RimJ/RimL family protein N-acetyltransferase